MNILKNTMDTLNDDKKKDTKMTVYVLGRLFRGNPDIMDAVANMGERTIHDFKRRTEQSINRQEIIEKQCKLMAKSCLSVDAFLQTLNQSNKLFNK